MRLLIFGFTIVTAAALSSCVGTARTDRVALPPAGPVRALTAEPGVVPEGTWLVVRTNDTMNADKALRSTIYEASVSQDVLDQNERLLIPKGSPVELGVRRLSYLGPGGAGMTELTIDVQSVTVNGVPYPVDTLGEPNAGGLGIDRFRAKWVGGGERQEQVLTSGRRIRVPAQSLLAFQIEDPIRLRGYQR
jgi:hypothetical protein